MHRTVTALSTVRRQLIDADFVEPAGHGVLRFVVPYLAPYLQTMDTLGRVD